VNCRPLADGDRIDDLSQSALRGAGVGLAHLPGQACSRITNTGAGTRNNIAAFDTEALQQASQLRYRLREVTDAPKGTVFMKRADRRKIRACLHPDRVQDPAAKKR
jgi:hypothetical protein